MASLDKYKITAVTWDSDKDPNGFSRWLDTFSAVVRATHHGALLEDFLDRKLDRQHARSSMIPFYITTDPDCEIDEPILNPRVRALPDEDEDAETDSGSQSGQSAFVLAPAARKFKELPEEARQLDAMLYNATLKP